MKLGVTTPVLTMIPRTHAKWEADNDFDSVVRVAEVAENCGYHHLTCSEHVAVPEPVAELRGGRYWDPLSMFGYLSAVTPQIRLVTHVLVLGYHHPLEIAKRYGTLDRVSGAACPGPRCGFAEGGVRPARRRRSPTGAPGATTPCAPCGLARPRREPIYPGPTTPTRAWSSTPTLSPTCPSGSAAAPYRSLRRAVELGDGWDPFGLTLAEMDEFLRRARDTEAWAEHQAKVATGEALAFETVLTPERPLDAIGAPDETAAVLASFAEAGATTLNVRVRHHSLEHCLEQLEALARLVP